jgi:hypothetical protein
MLFVTRSVTKPVRVRDGTRRHDLDPGHWLTLSLFVRSGFFIDLPKACLFSRPFFSESVTEQRYSKAVSGPESRVKRVIEAASE